MRKPILLLLFIFLMNVRAEAHPPKTLEAEYVASEGNVYIYMDHLSRDHRDHYIRKVVIYKNGEEVLAKSNRQQVDPTSASFTIPLEAEIGDEITIKAYCKEGGSKTETIKLEESGEDEEEKSEVKDKVSSTKEKKRQVQTHDSASSVDPNRSKTDVYGNKSEVYKDKTDPFKVQDDAFKSKSEVYEYKGSAY